MSAFSCLVWTPLARYARSHCWVEHALTWIIWKDYDSVPSAAIGFNVETVQYKNIKFQVWDLGGQSSIRPYWRCYFPNTSAIIYVIDSSDHDRLQTSRSELLTMLSEDELAGVPLLVFCNKQDVAGALKPEEISEQLGLAGGEKGRDWSVRGSCAVKGEGLEEGLDWLVNAIQKK
ncbi:hypothetical protein EWM64_g5377 [Hericium alpestre]|uniref:ADP-ribosylation factor-like protein 1 n=1 Tax=Hericium alpestre TaxID=135208 RepID=A0A4Y9ZVR0_9AGAM|nr:hypothetical protein EWM64_g5377 [Hericium alpestre]